MKATVKWLDGVAFVGESESGHAMVIDGAPAAGGRNIGPRPLETMLIGLGACSAFDVVSILRKARQAVTNCRVELEAERADAVPAVFTRIRMVFVVSGEGAARERGAPRGGPLGGEVLLRHRDAAYNRRNHPRVPNRAGLSRIPTFMPRPAPSVPVTNFRPGCRICRPRICRPRRSRPDTASPAVRSPRPGRSRPRFRGCP